MNYILPSLIALLLLYALLKKVPLYDAFVAGAKDALPLLVSVLPYMAAMLTAIALLRRSGALERFLDLTAPVFSAFGFPRELVPLFTLRTFSGSAAAALLQDVFSAHGPDSFLGIAASLMLGSTETVFYTVALYFGSVDVKKTRVAVPVALLSGVVGAAAAIFFAQILCADVFSYSH